MTPPLTTLVDMLAAALATVADLPADDIVIPTPAGGLTWGNLRNLARELGADIDTTPGRQPSFLDYDDGLSGFGLAATPSPCSTP